MSQVKVVNNFQDAIALMRSGDWMVIAWPYSTNDKLVWYFKELKNK